MNDTSADQVDTYRCNEASLDMKDATWEYIKDHLVWYNYYPHVLSNEDMPYQLLVVLNKKGHRAMTGKEAKNQGECGYQEIGLETLEDACACVASLAAESRYEAAAISDVNGNITPMLTFMSNIQTIIPPPNS